MERGNVAVEGFELIEARKEQMGEIDYRREVMLMMMLGKLIHMDPGEHHQDYSDAKYAEIQQLYVDSFCKNSYWDTVGSTADPPQKDYGTVLIGKTINSIMDETEKRWKIYDSWRESIGGDRYADPGEALFTRDRLTHHLETAYSHLEGHPDVIAQFTTQELRELTYAQLQAEYYFLVEAIQPEPPLTVTRQWGFESEFPNFAA